MHVMRKTGYFVLKMHGNPDLQNTGSGVIIKDTDYAAKATIKDRISNKQDRNGIIDSEWREEYDEN